MQQYSQAEHLDLSDVRFNQQVADIHDEAKVSEPIGKTIYENTQIADRARVQLGDQYHRNHGVVINASNVDISDQALRYLARQDLQSPSPRKKLGLCLGQAPQLEEEAFIGRTAELQQLREWFPGNSKTQKVVSIVGMGGLGKTQLSLTYAQENKDQYASVFWINAKDEMSLRQSLCTLAGVILGETIRINDASEEQMQVESVRRWLSEDWNYRWLVIFDNYDDPNLPNIRSETGFDIRSYFPHRVQGHILITTRSPNLTFSKRLMLQKLRSLDLSLSILSHRSGRDLNNDLDTKRLADRLDGLPLALATAGLYLGQTNISSTEYLQAYDTAWMDLHGPDSEELLEYEDRTLSSTWAISFDRVRRLDSDAAELFKFWLYFNNKDIWYELIQAGASTGPSWMSRTTVNKIRFDRAMVHLQNYSLVEVVAGSYSIHPCVHTWASQNFEIDIKSFLAALTCIEGVLPKWDTDEYWSITRRLLPHINRLGDSRFRTCWQTSLVYQNVSDFTGMFGHILIQWYHMSQAEEMYLLALETYEQSLDYNHIWTLHALNRLGILYRIRGWWDKAEAMYLRALMGKESVLGSTHWSTLATVHNLGTLYREQKKIEKAEEMLWRAFAGRKQILGRDDQSTVETLLKLAELHQYQGRLDEVEQECIQVLSCRSNGTDEERRMALCETARLLSKNVKLDIGNPGNAKRGLARLIGCIKEHDSAYDLNLQYTLARALLWIKDEENIPIAFSQVETAECDGCNQMISLDHGHHVCQECDDQDLCSGCMAGYLNKSLSFPDCDGHEYLDVYSAMTKSQKSPAKMSVADMSAWIDQLQLTYPVVADG